MHLLKSGRIFSNCQLFNSQNNSQLHSITLVRLMLLIFLNIQNHQCTDCQCVLCRTFISLLETLIDRGHNKLLEIILCYDFIDMLIFDTFLFNFCVNKKLFFEMSEQIVKKYAKLNLSV